MNMSISRGAHPFEKQSGSPRTESTLYASPNACSAKFKDCPKQKPGKSASLQPAMHGHHSFHDEYSTGQKKLGKTARLTPLQLKYYTPQHKNSSSL